MEINDLRRLELEGLTAFQGKSAPKAVVVAVNSVIDNSSSAAVWVTMAATQSTTTWNCWVATERAVGHAIIKYKKADYDQLEESRNELTPSGWSVWVRPLGDVIGIRYGAFAPSDENPSVFVPVDPIKVTFRDGGVSIPSSPIPVDQRAEAGRIIRAVREGVNF